MSEEFLHFVWQHCTIKADGLICTNGLPIQIIDVGQPNNDAGPDFFNAKIKIGDTLWAGNIEIHHKSSDWNTHNHHIDKGYNNVILHVVVDHNQEVFTQDNRMLPVFKLNNIDNLIHTYSELTNKTNWLPCKSIIQKSSQLEIFGWLERCAITKLELKVHKIEELLKLFNNDWDQVFFVLIARSFGFGTNSDPFEMVARQISIKVLLQYINNPTQVEALLFGQSGLLNSNYKDKYAIELYKEYKYLSSKHNLKPINSSLMKFLRLRPHNFPTIRVAQLATFICQSKGLWDGLIKKLDIETVKRQLISYPSNYWQTHFTFDDTEHPISSKHLGIPSINLIIINAIIPYMFAYGLLRSNETLQQKALDWLEQLPPEKNVIINKWTTLGKITPQNALESQALLYINNALCLQKKCLQCKIGYNYLSNQSESTN